MVDPRELRPEIKTPHAYADIARFSSAAENLGAAENSTHSSMLSSRRWPADEARGTPNRGSQSKGDANNSNQASPGAFLSANNNLEGRINVSKTEISGLDMSNSGIKWLTPTISRFTYLTELRLGGNMLKRLPSGISCLRNLCFLDLSNNQLQQISSEIGWLSCLRELLLFNNEIVDLPPELGYLYQLENLGIDGNPINDDLLAIAHNQGPLSIITFLRDHVISKFWNLYQHFYK